MSRDSIHSSSSMQGPMMQHQHPTHSNSSSQPNFFTQSCTTQEDHILETLETELFSNLKCSFRRFYVIVPHKYGNTQTQAQIWTLGANMTSKNTPIVLLHGYLAGLGAWKENIDALCESRPLYAIDTLGFGRSSRSQFSIDPIVAEAQFVDAIEEWRRVLNLPRIILLGHSFGGYLATVYALKYPKNCAGLILVDPWGFPPPNISQLRSQALLSFDMAKTGFYYVKNFVKTKTSNIQYDPKNQAHVFASYMYYINSKRPESGKTAFQWSIMNPILFSTSRRPLLNRFDKMDPNIPIWFIFGENSWIKAVDGYKAIALRPSYSKTFVKIFEGVGHEINGEKPQEFNDYVRQCLNSVDIETSYG